jgi:hypothetical protein
MGIASILIESVEVDAGRGINADVFAAQPLKGS